jgi:hypothetical protein
MIILTQGNHLWEDKLIGSSNLTIGADGCALTCLAMINNTFGENCTPEDVAAHTNWFTPQGLILWNQLNLKAAVFNARMGWNVQEVLSTVQDVEKMVMVQVQLPRNQTHWMLVDYLNSEDPNTFFCADPYSGKMVLSNHYGSEIGTAYFSKRIPILQ